MGQSSSTNSTVIDTSTTLSSLTQTIQNNSASTLNSVAASQDFTLNISGASFKGGSIDVSQKIDTTTNTSGSLTSNGYANVNADLKANLSDAVDQAAKASTGFLATGSSQSTNIANVKSKISVAVDNITKTDNWSKVVNDTVDVNNGTINIRNTRFDGTTIKYDQNTVATSIAVNVIKSVLDSASNALSTTDQQVSLTQKSDSSAGGLDSLFASLTSITGIWAAAAGGGVLLCCCCCCLIILSILMASSHSSDSRQ